MGKFSNEEIELAKKVQSTYGVPASITLAQYGLESGYGKSTVGKNNYFNIKGNGTKGYRDYESKEESFMDFGKLLTNENYSSHTSGAENVEEYIEGVKAGGYAEDPNYTSKVMSIINSNNLTQYDTGFNGTVSTSSKNKTNCWGDIVVVVFAILLITGGVAFMGFAVTGNTLIPNLKEFVKEVAD